jgi:PiT family inorganic phosphate transporter
MDAALIVAVTAAFAFALTNGIHDASNAIASLVATRAARPASAIVMAGICNMVGPLLLGSAVADTVRGIVTLDDAAAVAVIGSGLLAAVAWNLLTWRLGLPSSSGHALVGGLVGAAVVVGGADAVEWGGFDGWRPVGIVGILVALAVSPMLGGVVAAIAIRLVRRAARRATRRWHGVAGGGEWAASAALALSHGANDAQKGVGVIVALLVAGGYDAGADAPLWAKLGCGAALTVGTTLGGWRIVQTVGRRIYRIGRLDGLASQTASTAVILGGSLVGAPISTTHVVASSIVGVGGGRSHWRHVHWAVVREMGIAWATTIPATAALAAVTVLVWRGVA